MLGSVRAFASVAQDFPLLVEVLGLSASVAQDFLLFVEVLGLSASVAQDFPLLVEVLGQQCFSCSRFSVISRGSRTTVLQLL